MKMLPQHGCLSRQHSSKVLPIIYGSLFKNSQGKAHLTWVCRHALLLKSKCLFAGHWNSTVENLAQNVLKHYMETDQALYERCAAEHERKQVRVDVAQVLLGSCLFFPQQENKVEREARDKKWEMLEKEASDA